MADRQASAQNRQASRTQAPAKQNTPPTHPTRLGDAIQRAHQQRQEGGGAVSPQARGRRRNEAQRGTALQLAGIGLVVCQPHHAGRQAAQRQAARRRFLCRRCLGRRLLLVGLLLLLLLLLLFALLLLAAGRGRLLAVRLAAAAVLLLRLLHRGCCHRTAAVGRRTVGCCARHAQRRRQLTRRRVVGVHVCAKED
jgi:hypothetical protein